MIDFTAELKTAMKEKNRPVKSAIGDLKGRIKNLQIEKGIDTLSDEDFLKVVKSAVKVTKESIQLFGDAKNDEVVAFETGKLAYFEQFLPQQMDDMALTAIIGSIALEMSATKKDMGKVIGATRKRVAESGLDADGATISRIVKSVLE